MIQFDLRIFFNWVGFNTPTVGNDEILPPGGTKSQEKGEEGEGMKEWNFPSFPETNRILPHANRPFQNETGIPTIHFQDLLAW